MRNLVQLWLAGSLACFSITSQPSWGAESQQFGGKSQAAAQQNLNLPPQSLARSLIQLGKSRNISIIFPTRLVAGLEAPAVQGKLDTLEALEQLLANSPIHYRLLNPRVVRLEARPHIAETAAEPPLSYDFIEEVSVIGRQITGSRLKRHELEGSAPVDVISAPRIAELGAQSVGELLKFMPAVSGNSTSTSIGNGGNGTATVTLRGLPASNTLVLINGRRVANNGFAGKAVDLNSIAPETIEQIEILKSGSSAVYGSDAIAGVVNINLKKDYDGMAFNQYFGQSSRGDLQTHSSNLSLGRDFERGNIMLNASHYRQQPIFSRDRDLAASADGRNQGGSDRRSSAIPGGRYTLADGRVVTQADEAGQFRAASDEDLYNYAADTSAVSESERDTIYLSGNLSPQADLNIAADLSYNQTKALATLAPTPIFTAFNRIPLTIAADNIYNPFGEDIADARYRALEAGPRLQHNNSKSYRANLDINGNLGEQQWQLNWNWSRSKSSETLNGIFDGEHLQRALGPAELCQGQDIDGCTPVDLFSSAINTDQLAYISTQAQASGYSELAEISALLNHNLYHSDAGIGQLLAGISWRREKASFKAAEDQVFIGGSNLGNTLGQRRVREAFIEASLPLLNRQALVHSLDLELALRHANYSDFGSNSSPQFGLRYRPTANLLLRASYTKGFRAPSLQELHTGESQSYLTLNDPCSEASNVGALPGCQQQSDPNLNQFLTIYSGNTDLQAELAYNQAVGLVWTPGGNNRFYLSLDYYDIEQRNVVDSNAQFIVNQAAEFGDLAGLVERNNDGNIQAVYAPNLNIGRRSIRGLDLQLNYRLALAKRQRLELSLNASHIYSYRQQTSNDQHSEELAGTFTDEAAEGNGALPEWKVSAGFKYQRGPWQLIYNAHYISPIRELAFDQSRIRKTSSWLNQNLQLNYAVSKQLRLSLGVDNLFDNSPPYLSSAFLDNHDARSYDLRGRYWYSRLNYRFN